MIALLVPVFIALIAAVLFVVYSRKTHGETTFVTPFAPDGATSAGPLRAGARDPTPADVPAFLDRFCAAVASGDKAYVVAHTDDGTFQSSQVTDPTKCGAPTGKRCRHHVGGAHADADFHPVCARIQAQPRADLARSVHDERGTLRVRLIDGDLVSDLVIERQDADFRLMKEVEPGK